MQDRVHLPPGHLIEYHGFCKAIAQAVYPVRDQGLEGIECIVGKVVKHHVPIAQLTASQGWPIAAGLQTTLLSEDGRTLDQLFSTQDGAGEVIAPVLPFPPDEPPAIVELPLPYQLDDGDRRALEAVLPQLPPLRYPMAEEDATAFLSAYIKLPNRPAWEPVLMTEADVAQQRARQEQHFDNVLQSLRDEFAADRLRACTQSGLPVKAMTLRCFIPRQSAIDYLDRYGLAHDEDAPDGTMVNLSVAVNVSTAVILPPEGGKTVHAGAVGAERMAPEEEIAALIDDKPAGNEEPPKELEIQPLAAEHSASTKTSDTKRGAVKARYTYKQKKQIAAHYHRLKDKNVPDYCKQTAEKFGLSTRHVTNIVREVKEAEEAQRAKQGAIGRLIKRS